MRDRVVDSTIRISFNTNDGDGAPAAPSSAFSAADFVIYKDGSATQKTTTNGITVTSPFDSLVGLHLIEIDTSNDTDDAGFWALNSEYRVAISSAKTVDGVSQSGVIVGEFRLVSGTVELDSASLIRFVTEDTGETAAADGSVVKLAQGAGGSGSGTATLEKQEEILEEIRTYASSMLATVDGSAATIVGFPETLVIGDSYTTDGSNAIHVFVRDSNDGPVTAVGTHEFTDSDFAPEVIITTSGRAGRVRASVAWVPGGSEGYLRIQIPLSESHRAAPGAATVQVVLKWTGCEKTIATQTVTWIPRI